LAAAGLNQDVDHVTVLIYGVIRDGDSAFGEKILEKHDSAPLRSDGTWAPFRKNNSLGAEPNLPYWKMILRAGTGDKLGHGPSGMTLGKGWWLSFTQGFTTAFGVVLLAFYTGAMIDRLLSSRLALQEFDETRVIVRSEDRQTSRQLQVHPPNEVRLWSKKRILAYTENQRMQKGLLLAVLRFKRLNIRVPVFQGTDDWTLNRGAGWIEGTTRPGEAGNTGIAAHRDSFFRALRDAHKGDTMELATPAHTATYRVDQIEIVDPEDVAVLQAGSVPSLTLVTCYPFYFVGAAPQRFIVHAALIK